jgi:hypothetical protein
MSGLRLKEAQSDRNVNLLQGEIKLKRMLTMFRGHG